MNAKYYRLKYLILSLALVLVALTTSVDISDATTNSEVAPRFVVDLPSKSCPDGSVNCHVSSPVLADLTNDGRLEIIAATNNGHVVAINQNGAVLWSRDIAPYFGMAAGTQEIFSSPAVGDIDQDGHLDIVIGAGTTYPNVCTQGGVIALDRHGNVKPGWPRLSFDNVAPIGCTEAVYGTPALGDLTGDGYLEIVVGGFDKRIYAWRHDGTLLPGFPIDSFHRTRFPTWTDLAGTLADTIWSSPTLADLTGDGYPEIIIGTDEGNFDDRWAGDSGGWSCPYALPPGWAPGYCGGSLYVINRFGEILPGFPKYILETIQSTPVVTDANGDGWPEIFVGTGAYYFNNSPDRPTYGFRLHGWDRHGNDLPGWAGGKSVAGPVTASPSVGDITGNGENEIVVASRDGTLYAWQYNGQLVPGFPMTPRDRFGNTFPYGQTFILADYTGDGRMEIIFNQASMVTIVNGQGQQLTQSAAHPSLPVYRTWGANRNSPAVGDIDDNGRLDLVAHNSKLYVWELSQSSDTADWPMFKRNALRSGAIVAPRIIPSPLAFTAMHQSGAADTVELKLHIQHKGDSPMDWWLDLSLTDGDVVPSTMTGSLQNGGTAQVTLTIENADREHGVYTLGAIAVHGSNNSVQQIPITLVVGNISYIYLPAAQR
jgi:hypothetical protein